MAQQLFAKAALVDTKKLAAAQKNSNLVDAESTLQEAFATDVRPAIQEWRASKRLPTDPMAAFRQSGYMERISKERAAKNAHNVSSYAESASLQTLSGLRFRGRERTGGSRALRIGHSRDRGGPSLSK